jgi:hypothetical protein
VVKRLIAITFIFCSASFAWMVLGATLTQRTLNTDTGQLDKLNSQWGSAQTQCAPAITARIPTRKGGHEDVAIPIVASRINVDLKLEQRRVGLLWYNLYDVRFVAHYRVHNNTSSPHVAVHFALPATDATYSDFTATVNGDRTYDPAALDGSTPGFTIPPGQTATIDVGYRSRGMGTWNYRFGNDVQSVRDLALTMTTNFGAIDFPAHTLLPSSEQRTNTGWRLTWHYASLLTGDGIGMAFPTPMQPGPLAQRITFWAPVALFFYFFVMLVITALRGIQLHPINYFFLAASFFAFHLLFAYLVDRIPIEAAFLTCSAVTLFLTITYLRLVVGWRFAAVESGVAQLIYLILFSYALFNEGWSGLTITIGAIITLFVTMQATGRINWNERLGAETAQLGA